MKKKHAPLVSATMKYGLRTFGRRVSTFWGTLIHGAFLTHQTKGQIITLSLLFLLLFINCTPEMMKVTVTKNGATVSTIMPFDQKFKRSLKDSANVKVEIIKNM